MLHKELPKKIDPVRLCRNAPIEGTLLQGNIKLVALANLPEELRSHSDTVIEVRLHFTRDEQGLGVIKGEIAVEVQLSCQRCLEPMRHQINSSILVSPVTSDGEAKRLPAHYDPLLITNDRVDLSDWIAEELYLALPFVPRHDYNCVSY